MNTTRRHFARLAALAATISFVRPDTATAQTATPPPSTPPPPEEAKYSDFAQAQVAVIAAQYGEHLNADDVARISKDLHESAPFVDRLRAFELHNSDEPDFAFVARRGDE